MLNTAVFGFLHVPTLTAGLFPVRSRLPLLWPALSLAPGRLSARGSGERHCGTGGPGDLGLGNSGWLCPRCVSQIKVEGTRTTPGGVCGPHNRAVAGWQQSTKGSQSHCFLWGRQRGPGRAVAFLGPLSHHDRLSHMKQQIKNFLFYFYYKICTGKGRWVWEKALF